MSIRNIAIISNINMDPIGRLLDKEYSEVYLAGFNQYIPELIDDKSIINTKPFDIVFLHLDGSEYLKAYFSKRKSKVEIKKSIKDDLRVIFQAITNYTRKNDKTLFVINTIIIEPFFPHTYLENNPSYSFLFINNYVNDEIKNFAIKIKNLAILEWERIVTAYGYENLYDEIFYYLGRIKHTGFGLSKMHEELNRLITAYEGKIKKVIVLDLDNTLWGGIIGEDGIDGIVLSEDGLGKGYRDFQKTLSLIKNYGIVLAICSKNNFDDVKDCFENHPMMALKMDDFVSIKINWNDKVTNIREISSELNLGMDSFVFIDDNPSEREIVMENEPDVETPDFPADPAYLNKWFIDKVMYNYFPRFSITNEDKSKTKQYLANIKRKNVSDKLDIQSYINNLKIKLKLYMDDSRFLERTAQLTQKTNQFNMTTKRYTRKNIQSFIESKDYNVFNLEYIDRFNNEGIVGSSIVEIDGSKAKIDTFLMSCRVIGRSSEFKFLDKIIKFLQKNREEVNIVYAEFFPTKRNIVAKNFYTSYGIELIEKTKEKLIYESNIKNLVKSRVLET